MLPTGISTRKNGRLFAWRYLISVDSEGDISRLSDYVSTRIRLAFAEGLQFQLVSTRDFRRPGFVVTAGQFSENDDLRKRILDELKACVYVFGAVRLEGNSRAVCRIHLWGMAPPFEYWYEMETVSFENPPPWKLTLSESGEQFLNHVLLEGAKGVAREVAREDMGRVTFLTQPICDDLNLSWQMKDGMVYDLRKKSYIGTLRDRTGQVLQSRMKNLQSLKEMSYVIKDCSLIVKSGKEDAYNLQPYVLSEKSDYFFVPVQNTAESTGLRFQFIWGKRGASRQPSNLETGKGWKLYKAVEDYEIVMPVGTHIATATLTPVAESQYGSKQPRSRYVTRFKFWVDPGPNIYVVNYGYRQDRPEIFVRRLEIDNGRDMKVRSILKIDRSYRIYGEE